MPGMSGIQFLERAKALVPDTVRILLTGYADVQAAIDAINRGGVYRFLTKPWNNEQLLKAVQDGIQEYEMISALKNADEAKLLSLAQAVELKIPIRPAIARCRRICAGHRGCVGHVRQHTARYQICELAS
jgi:FixJ family two-component response regulator